MDTDLDAVLARCQRLQVALAAHSAALATLAERWRRVRLQVQALEAGFPPEQAARLAFWRWLAERRGETARRSRP
ncbi:MAG TPA: hypothetical protein VKZ60_07600 [Chloroflexota bacterium]|jgi:hypothetical protein|nr:hypothetical protein [Chloroflexota bacterium]